MGIRCFAPKKINVYRGGDSNNDGFNNDNNNDKDNLMRTTKL